MRAFGGSVLAAGLVLSAAAAQAAPASTLLGLMQGKRDTGRTVALEADVGCAPDKAYRMWTTAADARSFFAPSLAIDPRLGGRYTVAFFPDEDPQGLVHGTAGAHVLAQDPGRFLAFEWVTFAGDNTKGANAPPYAPETLRRPDPLPTWVELSFTPKGSGTHVAFRHFGFGEGALWSRSRDWFNGAWAGVLTSMTEACGKG